MKLFKTKNGLLTHAEVVDIRTALKSGAIIAFPTETVYGIGCAIDMPESIDAIYAMKERSTNKPMSLHISTRDVIDAYIKERPSYFEAFVEKFLPGPVTVILHNSKNQTVGFRYPDNAAVLQVIDACGGAIFGTSGNLSGGSSPKTADDVMRALKNRIDIVIDDGPSKYGQDSTVVLMQGEKHEILRAGIFAQEVEAFFSEMQNKGHVSTAKRSVLFVCTGNTCRSPMGEAWLRHYLKGIKKDHLIHVASCGVYACDGMRASQGAVARLKQEGIDLAGHKAHTISRDTIKAFDVIFCMSYSHKKAILDMVPEAEEKIVVLNVSDPIGFGDRVYDECYQSLRTSIQEYLPLVLQGIE